MRMRMRDEVLAKKPDPGLCNSHEGRFLKVFKANIIDNLKSHLFCFNTFGVRRIIDSENHPGSIQIRTRSGSGDLGLTGTSYTKSMKTKKKAYKII